MKEAFLLLKIFIEININGKPLINGLN